ASRVRRVPRDLFQAKSCGSGSTRTARNMGSADPISIKIRRTLRRSTAKNTPISPDGRRNSRKRGTLRAESQKRLNRDGPNLSRFDACGALAPSGFRLLDPMPRESRSAACSDRRMRLAGHNALVTDYPAIEAEIKASRAA